MRILRYKALIICLIGMLVALFSCQKEEIKNESENEESFKVETELSIDGVDVPVTKAENEQGWTTGDGIYHWDELVTLTANAKPGYELVTFYDKADASKANVGSLFEFHAQKSTTYKAEFRSIPTYCINCSVTGNGTVSGTGCGKTNGTYTLTATPSSGWSSNWTTKQVTVAGGDVNTSVTFTKNVQNITITLSNGYDVPSGRNYYYVRASSPVTTAITVKAIFRYREENVCEGRIIYDYDKDITITLSPGQQSGNDWIDATGSDSCIAVSINHKSTSTPWNGQTISGATYTVSGGF